MQQYYTESPSEEWEVQEPKLPHPYFLEAGYIKKLSEQDEKKPKAICRTILVKSVLEVIDTCEVWVEVEWEFQGIHRSRVFERWQMLTKLELVKLCRYGMDTPDDAGKLREILIYLSAAMETAPVRRVHTGVGFGLIGGRLCYKHHRTFGPDAPASTYQGDLLIEPKGSLDGWMNVVQAEVMGHAPLELALVCGLAAPVAALIGRETGLEVLMIHLYSDSSRGKTTAIELAVSPFGFPGGGQGSLVQNWNATANALIAHLRNIRGLAIALDEGSMRDHDFSSFIYQMASGRDKARLNQRGEMRESAAWEGVILSTAEHSLRAKSKRNAGIAVRLLEIGNITFTKSAANADAIKRGVRANYGWAGPLFAEGLLQMDEGELMAVWRRWQAEIESKMLNPDRFSSRLADRLAVIAATAELAGQALDLNFDIQCVLEILLGVVCDGHDQRDIGEAAYEFFIGELTRHSQHFASDHFLPERTETWGKVECQRDGSYNAFILPVIFADIMRRGNFDDPEIVLQNWRAKGMLEYEPGRLTRQKTILPKWKDRVHVVKLREAAVEGAGGDEPDNPTPAKRRPQAVVEVSENPFDDV